MFTVAWVTALQQEAQLQVFQDAGIRQPLLVTKSSKLYVCPQVVFENTEEKENIWGLLNSLILVGAFQPSQTLLTVQVA